MFFVSTANFSQSAIWGIFRSFEKSPVKPNSGAIITPTGEKCGLAANDVPDAWLAAAVIQQGEHLVSFDADFIHLLTPSQFTRLKA